MASIADETKIASILYNSHFPMTFEISWPEQWKSNREKYGKENRFGEEVRALRKD